MGENVNTPTPQSESDVLQAYQQYLPSLTAEAAAGTPGVAQAGLTAAQNTQPGYNQLNLQQLQQYGLPEAEVGQQIANSNAQAGAQTNLQQLQGAGGQAASAAEGVNKATNADYYTAQDAASKGAAEGVNAINLNGLSPGEYNSTERALNQGNSATGNLGNTNATDTITNAMNFGGAFNNKLGLLNNATNAATSAANSASSNGGFNGVNVALGQPNATGSNIGTNQVGAASSGTSAGSSGNAFNFAGGLVNSMNSANNSLLGANAQIGAAQTTANSPAAYLGGVCCFIFLEAFNGKIPWYVRYGRDNYYTLNKNIATGYRRVAKWLVPLMSKSKFIRLMVESLMVSPITQHLGHVTGHKGSKKNKFLTHTWLKVWSILGKNKQEKNYLMNWNYGILY